MAQYRIVLDVPDKSADGFENAVFEIIPDMIDSLAASDILVGGNVEVFGPAAFAERF